MSIQREHYLTSTNGGVDEKNHLCNLFIGVIRAFWRIELEVMDNETGERRTLEMVDR